MLEVVRELVRSGVSVCFSMDPERFIRIRARKSDRGALRLLSLTDADSRNNAVELWQYHLLSIARDFGRESEWQAFDESAAARLAGVIRQILENGGAVEFTPLSSRAAQIAIRAEDLIRGKVIGLPTGIDAEFSQWVEILDRCCNCLLMLRVQTARCIEPFPVRWNEPEKQDMKTDGN